jgi:hypothetical protein
VSEPEAKTYEAHAAAVAIYKAWIWHPDQAAYRAEVRRCLRGKHLMCFCKPHLPCHVDVLLEVANSEED